MEEEDTPLFEGNRIPPHPFAILHFRWIKVSKKEQAGWPVLGGMGFYKIVVPVGFQNKWVVNRLEACN